MKLKGLKLLASAGTLGIIGIAHADLQLTINGDKVTGPDGLVKFQYNANPSDRQLVLESFFQSLRCIRVDEVTGTFTLSLDKLNSAELDADYEIPSDADIEYAINAQGNGVVNIQSSSIEKLNDQPVSCEHIFPVLGLIQEDGTPERDITKLGDFERVFDVTVTPAPETEDPGFDIEIFNNDEFFVGRDIIVELNASNQPEPEFSVDGSTATITTAGWKVSELWPGQSRILNIRYPDLSSGEIITLDIDDVAAQNRQENLTNQLITVVNTSTLQQI